MKMIVNVGIGILIVAIASFAMSGRDVQPTKDEARGPVSRLDVVDSFISRQAKRLGAEEYLEAREVLRGDVDDDGKADLVVLYTLEGFGGSNAYRQYLAIFLARGSNFRYAAHKAVGGKLFRLVSLKSVLAGRINLDTTRYRKNDPACCPTKEGKTTYSMSKGRLIEGT